MKYDLVLSVEGKDFETVKVTTDDEMYTAIGRFTMQYFLSIDGTTFIDTTQSNAPDRILASIIRTRQYSVFAKGNVWIDGRKQRALLFVRKENE